MNDFQYEVIIIGSGATGGIAAKTFAENGINVLLIEAGPELSSKTALGSEPENFLRRIKSLITGEHIKQAQHPGFWKANPLLYMNEIDNPYQHPPGKPFIWTQGRQVGGRSLTWGGITLRLSDREFKCNLIDGFGPNWPINHKDLSTHYSKLEKEFKVHGKKDNLEQLPDGDYQKEIPLNETEEEFANNVRIKLNFPVINSRGFDYYNSNLHGPWPLYSSPGSSLKNAYETRKVKILSNHIVERILMSKDRNSAEGVIAIDKLNKVRKKLYAKLIIVCASTIQTNRLLLDSEENAQENGFIDPSKTLGCFLMDHISTCRFFLIPEKPKESKKIQSNSSKILSGAGSFFIPFGTKFKNPDKIDFLRGYGIWGGIDRFGVPNWLTKNRKLGFLIGHGEVLARKNNRVTLSKSKDKWGISQPFIDINWSENEEKMVKHMNQTIAQVIDSAGGEITQIQELINIPLIRNFLNNSIALKNEAPPPGYYIHEVGGARMGINEETSVVDRWNRLWRCQNVLVVDGACLPTSGWQSPTLTMMAITRRACLKAISSRNA